MFDCYLCKKQQADLCTSCSSQSLLKMSTERDYLALQLSRLTQHLDKRLVVLGQPRRAETLKEKVEAKKAMIEEKYRRVALAKRRVQQSHEKKDAMQQAVKELIEKLSQAKTDLDQVHYQKGIYGLCDMDGKLTEARRVLEGRLGIARRCLINTGAEAFDIHPEYPRYSVGQREFRIERVSLLQKNQDYVMIDQQATSQRNLNDDDPLLQTTSIQGKFDEALNLVDDYLDTKDQAMDSFRSKLAADLGFGYPPPPSLGPTKQAIRKNTMEQFESFEGDTSMGKHVPKKDLEDIKDTKKEVKEEFYSQISLIQVKNPPEKQKRGLGFSTLYEQLTASEVQSPTDRYEKVQGALHTMCLMLNGLSTILQIPLPYRLIQTSHGFRIQDSASNQYPLYMKSTPSSEPKNLLAFDDALVLLDRDILYLLLLHGYPCPQQGPRPVLNLGALLFPKEPAIQSSLGRYLTLAPRFPDREKVFEILQLSKQVAKATEKRSRKQSKVEEAKAGVLAMHTESSSNEGSLVLAPGRPKNDWSDDDQYVELLAKAKELNLSSLVDTEYIGKQV